MSLKLVTIPVDELLGIINDKVEDAYAAGYVKAKKEVSEEEASYKPKFCEIIRGSKELKEYLEFKGYWFGSINTLNKVANQLIEKDEQVGRGLIFRRGCIDHAFEIEKFRFNRPVKK